MVFHATHSERNTYCKFAWDDTEPTKLARNMQTDTQTQTIIRFSLMTPNNLTARGRTRHCPSSSWTEEQSKAKESEREGGAQIISTKKSTAIPQIPWTAAHKPPDWQLWLVWRFRNEGALTFSHSCYEHHICLWCTTSCTCFTKYTQTHISYC